MSKKESDPMIVGRKLDDDLDLQLQRIQYELQNKTIGGVIVTLEKFGRNKVNKTDNLHLKIFNEEVNFKNSNYLLISQIVIGNYNRIKAIIEEDYGLNVMDFEEYKEKEIKRANARMRNPENYKTDKIYD